METVQIAASLGRAKVAVVMEVGRQCLSDEIFCKHLQLSSHSMCR